MLSASKHSEPFFSGRLVLRPHRHPGGEQRSNHCGKVNRRHRHPGAVRAQPGEPLQRHRPSFLTMAALVAVTTPARLSSRTFYGFHRSVEFRFTL